MLSYIVYDNCQDCLIIYEARLTDEETREMERLHCKFGNSNECSPEDDTFLSDLENNLSDCKKVFDSSAETGSNLLRPIVTIAGVKVYVTGFIA